MTEPTVEEGGRAILTGISSRAFEHPADRAALTAMRSIPGFDQFLRLTSGMLRERQYRLAYLASSVRVGPHQFSDLHELMDEVTTILDAPERPELYVYNHPVPNATTLGVDRAFIAISSALYELTDHGSCSVTNSGMPCPGTRCTSRSSCTCSTWQRRSAGCLPVGSGCVH